MIKDRRFKSGRARSRFDLSKSYQKRRSRVQGYNLRYLLWVYEESGPDSLLNRFLASFENQTALNSLRNRRIALIKRANLTNNQALIIPREDGFAILLKNGGSLREWMISVGHELCHTFEYDLNIPAPRLLDGRRKMFDNDAEDFCTRFADEWLKRESRESELKQLLEPLGGECDLCWIRETVRYARKE